MLAVLAGFGVAHGFGGVVSVSGSPIELTASRVAIGIDPAGFVETHVQVSVEGAADAFVWVVPIRGSDPEVFVSTDRLFEVLDQSFAPQFETRLSMVGTCRGCALSKGDLCPVATTEVLFDTEATRLPADLQLGPYDSVLLEDLHALVEYLAVHALDAPDLLSSLSATSDTRFLAIYLEKDADIGHVAPVGFRVMGTGASLSLLPNSTAVADVHVQANVLADVRAVPANALNVVVNDERLDWTGSRGNYAEVLQSAVAQAGGQAFVTEFAGSPAGITGYVWSDGFEERVQGLREAAALGETTQWVETFGYFGLSTADSAVRRALDGVVEPAVVQDPLAAEALSNVDLVMLTEQLDVYVFEPRRRAQRLVARPMLTRLSTHHEAAGLPLEPLFVLNPDAPDVDNLRRARWELGINRQAGWSELVLEDGRTYQLTRDEQAGGLNRSDVDALVVEQYTDSGSPVVVLDRTEEVWGFTDPAGEPNGCSSGPLVPGVLLGALGVMGVRRRSASDVPEPGAGTAEVAGRAVEDGRGAS